MRNFSIQLPLLLSSTHPSAFHSSINVCQVGKLADIVLWRPAFFGAKPEMVIKGGAIAWAQMGDANASIPTPEPVSGRPEEVVESSHKP